MKLLPDVRSVRIRLLAIALLPMLVVMPLLLGIAIARWWEKVDSLLISKVNGDLTIAHQYLSHILENSGERTSALGASEAFAKHIRSDSPENLTAYLDQSRSQLAFDFLYLTDGDGRVLASSPAIEQGAFKDNWPVIRSAQSGKAATGIDLFSAEDLSAISDDLAARARVDLVPTDAAVPTERTVETRGLVVHTATPVTGRDGVTLVLVGGILLNRNLSFIDTINDLVYREASLPEGSRGTATLFLDDVRVSTNVRLFENVRALGTRVSAEVRGAVLGAGSVWLDRAFVVNDWYISAYEPIRDSHGNRVGMLYVGFLEKPFRNAKYAALATIVAAFLIVAAIMVPIFLRWVRRIFKPLEQMTLTIGRVEAGDLGARIGKVKSSDEIGQVANHLDMLLDQVQERDRELRDWAGELNSRVEARTRELTEANKRLESATQQLVMSEKLAAIGEITAGVAHEINNPVAVIQGNLDVIRESLGPASMQVGKELRLIDEQVTRINLIVNKLLQFASPEEYSGDVDQHVPDDVISDCMLLVRHLMKGADITVHQEATATGLVSISRTELQQVLINLIVNAIHAMPNGGKLALRTRDSQSNGLTGVLIEVADTGRGMAPDVLKKAFDPFFTTKRREGTGLGLSISQKLINRAGGYITAESTLGEGTTFTVFLPTAT